MKKQFQFLSILFSVVFLSLSAGWQVSHAQVSIASALFLKIEPDARYTGMGNAAVSFVDDATAVYWNPAGLSNIKYTDISITYSDYLAGFGLDIYNLNAYGSYHVNGIGTFGGGLIFQNNGSQVYTDEFGRPLGTFNSVEIASTVSYGFNLNRNFAMGGSIKFIYSKLAASTTGNPQKINPGVTFTVDIGMQYRLKEFQVDNIKGQVKFGLNLSNMGYGIQYIDNSQLDPVPTELRVGSSLHLGTAEELHKLTLALDISKLMVRTKEVELGDGTIEVTNAGLWGGLFGSWGTYRVESNNEDIELTLFEQLVFSTGMEYWYESIFGVRFGYYHENKDNGNRQLLTTGMSINYYGVGVDFSYIIPMNDNPGQNGAFRVGIRSYLGAILQ